jgi:hypothetical protein
MRVKRALGAMTAFSLGLVAHACGHDWDTLDPGVPGLASGSAATGGGGAGATTGSAGQGGGGPDASVPDASVEGFSYRRKLTFDNGGGSEDLVDFPVLVVLNPSRIDYDALKPNGEDIRFYDADLTSIPYEIERWDSGAESIVWVRVPRIDAGSTTDFIYIYYGNPDLDDAQAHEAVWANYQAVYHLGDPEADSSPNHFDGVNNGADNEPGVIGGCSGFDGNQAHIDLGADRPFVKAAPGFTLGAWIWPDFFTGTDAVIFASSGQGSGPPFQSRAQIMLDENYQVRGSARTSDQGGLVDLTGAAAPDSQWTWGVVVADFAGNSMKIYVNGELTASDTNVGFSPLSANTDSSVSMIGIDENFGSLPFRGRIDEVSLSLDAKSAAWIKAQYTSMTDALITFGPEEPL